MIYALLGGLLGIALLFVQAGRFHNAFASGKLLVTGDWYADWSSSPLGFGLALILHVAMTLFALGLVWYGVATVRHWLLER